MRVAMFSWESLHSIWVGGVGVHVTELAAALGRLGHEVHVFTRMAHGQRYYDKIDGAHYHRCPYQGHQDFVDDVNNMCRAFVERFFTVEDMVGEFDIVHAHDWLAANAMIWIKQKRPRKCAMTFHSTEYARCGNAFSGGRSNRVRAQERAGAYWADKVICVSQATRSEVIWMYEAPEWKTSVVYNGVTPKRFEVDIEPGAVKRNYDIGPMDPTSLFCGRLEWQKGPDLLLEIVPGILKHYSNAKFVFAGDGRMRGELERRARHLGVAHAVRFLGFRNGKELPQIFKLSDVVCVPSRNEPFGIVILEAWSAGKPVVATQTGGPAEFVRHEYNGLKVFPKSDSIAWGLGTMLANHERARWMGQNGRQAIAECFTWDLIARQTLAVYGHEAPQPRAEARMENAPHEASAESAAKPGKAAAVRQLELTEIPA